MSSSLVLDWLTTPDAAFAVCRLPSDTAIPAWSDPGRTDGSIIGLTRTPDELSIVAPAAIVPDPLPEDVRSERGWAGLKVVGPLDFGLTGVIARLAGALAAAEISVFVISTFDTDILLVKHDRLDAAIAALGEVADVARLRSAGD